MAYLIVFLGAGLGGALRHGANLGIARYGYAPPFATLLVNILGSFLIGALAGYFAYRTGISQHVRLFLTTGMLGGFTTFSTFSLDTALLIERHNYALAAGYAVGSVGIGIAAFFFGLAIFETRSQLP